MQIFLLRHWIAESETLNQIWIYFLDSTISIYNKTLTYRIAEFDTNYFSKNKKCIPSTFIHTPKIFKQFKPNYKGKTNLLWTEECDGRSVEENGATMEK